MQKYRLQSNGVAAATYKKRCALQADRLTPFATPGTIIQLETP
jgi:hypothetical protein